MTRRRIWALSLAASVVLLAAIMWLAEPARLLELAGALSWPMLLAALGLFELEGVCTALRVRALAPAGTPLSKAFEVTAWWVAALVVLPARLGELAGVHQLVRRLGCPLGQAVNSLFMQRLLDGLVLLAVALVVVSLLPGTTIATTLMAAGLLAGVLVVTLSLRWLFGLLIGVTRRWRGRPLVRALLRLGIHGRRAALAYNHGPRLALLVGLSVIKWVVNVTAVTVVLLALVPLSPLSAACVAVLIGLSAVIPLQTVGGIGISETVVTASLNYLGVDVATAASIALLLRALFVVAPLLFLVTVITVVPLMRRRRTL